MYKLYKLFNFLKRNFLKIIWSLAILVWVAVGIYYFSTNQRSLTSQPSVPLTGLSSAVSKIPDEVESFIGLFQNWETIQGSKDKYVLLTDQKTGETFPKIRVGFEFNELFGHKERKDSTVFAVEKGEEGYEVLGYLEGFTSKEIEILFEKGDYIKILLEETKELMEQEEAEDNPKGSNRQNLRDKNNNLVAHWLFIKREKGRIDLEKELGIKIEVP